jgi:two-component system cell cycle sensor histidine kinase/response regulator CckA
MLEAVRVPKQFEPVFERAQEYVRRYFAERQERPSEGTIEILGQRYILVRAASMSVEFFALIRNLYADKPTDEAAGVARSLLFDIAHALGVADARAFHARLDLKDPVEKMSVGPLHFAHAGWAFVDIHAESRPSPDQDYYLIYDHPYSFESDSWMRAGEKVDFPVCVMNAGYSSGWCEASFGLTLVASEILCKAKGDEHCRFIMAPPDRIEGHIDSYRQSDARVARHVTRYEIPGFFARKKVEDELREREEQYRSVFESATDAFFVCDVSGDIVEVSPAGCTMFGAPRAALLGRSLRGLLRPASLFDDLRAWIGTTGKFRAEGSGVAAGGNDFEVEIHGVAFSYRKQPHVLAVIRNIAERKRMEEALFLSRNLESIGVLAGGIAHDFNNLLTVIMGNLSLARLSVPAEGEAARLLGQSERAAARARDLTMQLLTFSRGGAPIKELTALGDVLRESATLVLRGSRVRPVFDLPPELWPASVDRGQLGQVVANLVINADQAMPDGGVVTVAARNVAPGDASLSPVPLPRGHYVRVDVKDEGVGIPPEQIERVFDPYFTTRQGGTGLGLATTYSIVRRHNGHVALTSAPGRGATFSVWLPAVPGAAVAASAQPDRTLLRGAGRVLVMDDDAMVRELLASMLRELGYTAAAARDGGEAVAAWLAAREAGTPFDVVVMDLTIPGGMGGLEALQRMRTIDPGVKAIVSSGYSNDPVMASYRTHGFAGVMAKPYSVREVGQIVQQALAR